MSRDITDKTLQGWIIKAKKPSKAKYILNKIQPCLYFRVSTANHTGVFIYRVKTATINTIYTIGEYPAIDLHTARLKAQELKTLISQGYNPIKYEQEQETMKKNISQVYDLWLPTLKTKGSADNSQAQIISFRIKYLSLVADVKMDYITPELIRSKVLNPLIASGKLNTAHNCLLRFKQLAKFAFKRRITAVNTLEHLDNDFFTPNQRNRILTKDEIKTLILWLSAHDDTPAKHLKLSLMLGNRMNELLRLQWCNVDLIDSTIKLTDTKNKQDLTIKLPGQALAIIQELQQLKHGDYVFANGLKPFTYTAIHSRIKNIIADTGMAKFTHHDLRRTFSSYLAEMGFSADLIDCATNHKLQGIRRNYIHTDKLELRYKMLCDWCEYLEGLLV